MTIPIRRRRVVVEPHVDRISSDKPFWFSIELSEHDGGRCPIAQCSTHAAALALAGQAAEQLFATVSDETKGAA